MKKHFLVVRKDYTTKNLDAYLVTDVAYFEEDEYNFYRFTKSGYQVDNNLVGVWFGLESGEHKIDTTAETAECYEQALLANKMAPAVLEQI